MTIHRSFALPVLIAISLALVQPVAMAAPPAKSSPLLQTDNAISTGDCGDDARETPYNWSQHVCMYDSIFVEGLISVATVELQPGFRRANVKKCRIRLRMVSSYGSVNWAHIDCTNEVRGGVSPSIDWTWTWGTGRRSGDTYTVEAWAEITTGVRTYGGRPWSATSTTVKL